MSGDIYVSFGAETGELESAMARTKAEVQALGRELTSTAREMQKSGADMDSALGQSLTQLGQKMAEAKTHMAELRSEMREAGKEGATGALAQLREMLEGVTSPLMAVRNNLGEIGELFAAVFAVEKLADFVTEVTEASEKIERMSAMLGATTDQVQRLFGIAKLTGTETDEMARAMERMQLQLARVKETSSPAAEALKVLGINAEAFRSLDMQGQIEELAEAFSHFADGPTKTAAAMALLGRSGAQMIPFLDRGKEGFAELNKILDQTGIVMGEKDVHAMGDLEEKEKTLGLATEALAHDIGIDLAIAAKDAIGWMTSLAESIDKVIRSERGLIQNSQDMGAAAGALIGAHAGQTGLTPDIMAGVPDAWKQGRDVTVHAKKPQVPQMDIGGAQSREGSDKAEKDAEGAERQGVEEDIALTERATQAKLAAYNDDLAHHRVSVQQWLKDSEAALNKEAADVKKLYDQESSIAGQSATKVAEIKKQEALELAKINAQIVADERKAADEAQKQWETSLTTIFGAMNSALKGMMSGHETFRQAMTKSLEQIGFKALDTAEQMLVRWISMELAKTAATTAGTAARTAAETGGASAGIAADAAAALQSIMTSAAAAFAGVFGFMAPLMGPFAAGPAAAAQATVMSAAGSVASADIGMYQVPSDQLAMIHRNELVMPAGQAGAFRDLLSGAASGGNAGGMAIHPTTNISVSGVADAAWWRNNSSDVVRAVEKGVRSGAALAAKRLRTY